MKQIIIKKLSLRNFRGIKDFEIKFNENGETNISGENATGKSTIFNGYTWLLFGKDKEDRKDFNIRPLIDGQLLRHVDCEVCGIFSIDGEEITLRRLLKEKWVKPRGQVDEVFKGNETECFWNNVPVSTTDYQKRINEIINDSVFKMVSIPYYFPKLDWKLQREQLFQLSGTITDVEIGAKKPEFATLLDRITGKSFADFKREISALKKRLKEDLEQIQPRIDQTHKLMPESADFSDLEKQEAEIEKEISSIDKAIADKSEAIRQQYEAVQKKQSKINELKQKRQQVLHEAKTTAKESAFEANAIRRSLENNININENELSSLERSIQSSERELNGLKERITEKDKAVVSKRQEWFDLNATEYNGDDTCHECGQVLPEERRSNARQSFVDSKQKKLAQIRQNGSEINTEIEQLNKEVSEIERTLKTSRSNLESKKGEIANLKDELERMPIIDESEINPDDLPEYRTLGDIIKGLESTLDTGTQAIDTTDLQNRKKGFQQMRDEIKEKSAKRELIEKYGNEIKNLEAKGKDIAQQIADAEREEYTIAQFAKERINECERRINGLFNHVTFKLFDYTIDGNEYECCVPLVCGVPFDVANTAGQVNAGLDIINALVKFHGVSAPIFIDGRESVNRIIETESQIINLVVSKDKELIIR